MESLPTSGQLERTLSQSIQALYRDQMGHRLERVTCQIVDRKILIMLESAVTQPEQLLANSGKEELVEEIRSNLDEALQPQIRELVERVTGVDVVDLLSDAKLDTERMAIVAVLSEMPATSDRSTSSKNAS
jgi:uncharacterized protein YbcI